MVRGAGRLPGLAVAGIAPLAPDLPGHGASSEPRGDLDADHSPFMLRTDELVELLVSVTRDLDRRAISTKG